MAKARMKQVRSHWEVTLWIVAALITIPPICCFSALYLESGFAEYALYEMMSPESRAPIGVLLSTALGGVAFGIAKAKGATLKTASIAFVIVSIVLVAPAWVLLMKWLGQ